VLARRQLLHWLNHHHAAVFPAERLAVTNFDADLRDCRALAAAFVSHLPSTRAVFAEMQRTAEPAGRLKNARKLAGVAKDVGLPFCPAPEVLPRLSRSLNPGPVS
jgi:hypothetical protein